VYCPSGSSSPIAVLTGWYSTPDLLSDNSSLRSGTQQCAAGEFCVGGVRASCPAGKYSDTLGQTACLPCPAGAWLHASVSCAPLTPLVSSPLCCFLLVALRVCVPGENGSAQCSPGLHIALIVLPRWVNGPVQHALWLLRYGGCCGVVQQRDCVRDWQVRTQGAPTVSLCCVFAFVCFVDTA
jgi:hypothetical protein